jgi:hypothetical protein
MDSHWVSVHEEGFPNAITVSVSAAFLVIEIATELIYVGRNAFTPMRMTLSTVSEIESMPRWLFEFTNTIEIVAFDAVKGLGVSEQERRRGIESDKRMRSSDSFLHIMQFSGEKIDRTILLQGNLVYKNIILGY